MGAARPLRRPRAVLAHRRAHRTTTSRRKSRASSATTRSPRSSSKAECRRPIEQPLRDLRERTRDLLAAAGMHEVITYSMTTLEALSARDAEGRARHLPAVSRREPGQQRPRAPANDAAREPAADARIEPAIPARRGRDLRDRARRTSGPTSGFRSPDDPSARRRCPRRRSTSRASSADGGSTAGAGPATRRSTSSTRRPTSRTSCGALASRRSTSPQPSSRWRPGARRRSASAASAVGRAGAGASRDGRGVRHRAGRVPVRPLARCAAAACAARREDARRYRASRRWTRTSR